MKTLLLSLSLPLLLGTVAAGQVQKLPRQTTRFPTNAAVKKKESPFLAANSVKLVTGAPRRHLTRPVRDDRRTVAVPLRTTPLALKDFAPALVNFGELKVNQTARATVTVIVPEDGEVRVRYSDRFTKSRIVQVTAFGGDWSSEDAQDASPVPAMTSTSGTITARAGQELRIEVEFASPQAGRIDGTVEASGAGWVARVPTTAAVSLLGRLGGALVLPVERALTGIAGTTLEVPVRVLSLSNSTVTAQLLPQEVPVGVTVEPFSLTIGPGQTLSGNLRLRLSDNTPEALEAPLRLTIDTGSAAKGQVLLSLNLYQPWKEFRFYASNNANLGSFARFEGVVQIKADGTWNLEGMGSVYGAEKVNLSFAFKGFGALGRLYTETISAQDEFLVRRSGTSLWLKQNYGEAARAGVIATTYELD